MIPACVVYFRICFPSMAYRRSSIVSAGPAAKCKWIESKPLGKECGRRRPGRGVLKQVFQVPKVRYRRKGMARQNVSEAVIRVLADCCRMSRKCPGDIAGAVRFSLGRWIFVGPVPLALMVGVRTGRSLGAGMDAVGQAKKILRQMVRAVGRAEAKEKNISQSYRQGGGPRGDAHRFGRKSQ